MGLVPWLSEETHLMSPKSFLFPAMATTMSSGPCSFSSFTHFFSVWKESWATRKVLYMYLYQKKKKKNSFKLLSQSHCFTMCWSEEFSMSRPGRNGLLFHEWWKSQWILLRSQTVAFNRTEQVTISPRSIRRLKWAWMEFCSHQFCDVIDDDGSSRASVVHRSQRVELKRGKEIFGPRCPSTTIRSNWGMGGQGQFLHYVPASTEKSTHLRWYERCYSNESWAALMYNSTQKHPTVRWNSQMMLMVQF